MTNYRLAYRPAKAKRIKVAQYGSEFERNAHAQVLSDSGFKVRKLKPKRKVV